MAKAGKSQEKKASAAPKAAKKSAKAAKPASAAAGNPLINTSLAAQNAAKLLAAGFSNQPVSSKPAAPQAESAMFKQLKAGLNKPTSSAMSNLLEKSHGPEPVKSRPHTRQVGHNQTFGADVARSGVPRRTPG